MKKQERKNIHLIVSTYPWRMCQGDILRLQILPNSHKFLKIRPPSMQHLMHVLIVSGESHIVRHLALRLEVRRRYDATNTELLRPSANLLDVLQRILELPLGRTERGRLYDLRLRRIATGKFRRVHGSTDIRQSTVTRLRRLTFTRQFRAGRGTGARRTRDLIFSVFERF